jgi:3-hydroxybutyryl-CoA dehydrogenase
MEIKKVLIVGVGLMGSGIAQVCAQSGINVVVNDISKDAIDKGLKNIAWSISKFIEKGKLTEDKEIILDRIAIDDNFSNAADADLAKQ